MFDYDRTCLWTSPRFQRVGAKRVKYASLSRGSGSFLRHQVVKRFWDHLVRTRDFRKTNISYLLRGFCVRIKWIIPTALKVSVFGVFLIRIFPHSDWIWRDTDGKIWNRKTLNTDIVHAVPFLSEVEATPCQSLIVLAFG